MPPGARPRARRPGRRPTRTPRRGPRVPPRRRRAAYPASVSSSRDVEPDRRSRAGHRLDPELGAQDLRALAHRGQAVVGQAVVGACREARAVVAHLDVVPRLGAAAHRDRHPARRGVLHGVLDGLADDLVEEHLVVGRERRPRPRRRDRSPRGGCAPPRQRALRPLPRTPGRAAPTARGRTTARASSERRRAAARARSRAPRARSRGCPLRCPRPRRRASSRCPTWSGAGRRGGRATACGARPARPRRPGVTGRPARSRASGPGRGATRPGRRGGRSWPSSRRSRRAPTPGSARPG